MNGTETGEASVTNTHWQRFSVPFEYPVIFTSNVFDPGNPALIDTLTRYEKAKRHRCLIFVDDGLLACAPDLPERIKSYAQAHSGRIELVASPMPVPGGEKVKNELAFVEQAQDKVYEHGLDRHSYVIGVGGGAVLDMVGLVAATSHRGVRHVRIPTTVLSQNDSGVGVKNGVNLNGVKNFVGTFAPPFAVINDFDLLSTLPVREKIAGMAEAVKVALIRDRDFFHWLERNADALALVEPEAMAYMIRRCAELHMHQIAHGGDPFETGSARPLDFGHWAAHKLESITHPHLRHGEAVAIGIALDTRYSVLSGLLPDGLDDRVCFLLDHLGFKLWHPALRKTDASGNMAVLRGLREFREHLGGELTITMLSEIGTGVDVHEIDEAKLLEAVEWLDKRREA